MANIKKLIIEYIKKYIENTERRIRENLEQIYSNKYLESNIARGQVVNKFAFIENNYTKQMNLRIIIDITLDNLIVLIKSINNKISHTFFNREETKVFLQLFL
jgi:hypothetical protein